VATQVTPNRTGRIASFGSRVYVSVLAVVLPLAAGYFVTWAFVSTIHSRNFPWITGRALGIAGYLALTALVALGVWMRHPWRYRVGGIHPESQLRSHATLGVATIVLVVGHLVFLAADRYAGVGWIGAIVPGLSQYRRAAVALGVGAFELLVLIAATARFAGRRGTRHWLAVHRLASVTFMMTWFHGVLAGTDTAALRVMYLATGSFVAFLVCSRVVMRRQSDLGVDEFGGEMASERQVEGARPPVGALK